FRTLSHVKPPAHAAGPCHPQYKDFDMTATLEHPMAARSEAVPLAPVSGLVDLQGQTGFLRVTGYLPGPQDLYLSADLIRRHKLRTGDLVVGAAAAGKPKQAKARPLAGVAFVNGERAERLGPRPRFADLTPIHPRERLRLET